MTTENTEKSDAELFAELMGEAAAQPAEAAPETPPAVAEEAPPADPPAEGEVAPATPPVASEGTPPSQAAENVPEWLQAMPDEARRAWQELQETNARLQQDFSRERQARAAVEGRLAPIQRKLAQYETGRDSPRAAAPTAATRETPSAPAVDSFYDSAGWKKFEAEFPEEAATQRAAMEWTAKQSLSRIEALEQTLSRQQNDPRLAQLNEHLDKVHLEGEIKALAEVHPDWQEINQSAEFAEWLGEWRLQQPSELSDIYMDDKRFARMCTDSKFASSLLHQFKRDAYIADLYLQQSGSATPAPGTPPAPTPATQQPGSALLAMTRAPDVKGGATPRKVDFASLPEADQFDLLFNGPPR